MIEHREARVGVPHAWPVAAANPGDGRKRIIPFAIAARASGTESSEIE
ncbi:hypothetical protein [Burkholderia stagnalis]|nr:hypothetical protein [Burkholderia stagnalis]MDY7807282.1 hypothetical protein [Burkholderia stagnalis]